MKTPAFESESDLCARFIAAIDAEDWTAYAETGGWDILLVRKADGFQIGIEAKLKFTPEVISQCLEEFGGWNADRPGPDCRAVLVPSKGVQHHLHRICMYIGITVIQVESPHADANYIKWNGAFRPKLPKFRNDHGDDWPEHAPAKRIKLPDYVPDVAAGAKSPLQLTSWKIKAIKVAITLEKRGHLTRKDFAHLHIDHRLWIAPEKSWLVVSDGVFMAGTKMPKFKKQHPKVYAEIAKDFDRWCLKEQPLPLQQKKLL